MARGKKHSREQAVTRLLTADFQMQPEAEDGSPVADIAGSYIKPNDRLSSFDRLEIYNRQYWFRVIGAVSEDFSALQADDDTALTFARQPERFDAIKSE
jgi:hypothetical protein